MCTDYEAPVAQWVGQLKYGGQYGMAKVLAAWLTWVIHPHHCTLRLCKTLPDCWVAVPMHPSKIRVRGYNQAHELARALSDLTGRPLVAEGLRKVRRTAAQAENSMEARSLNLLHSMVSSRLWRGQTIGLVDDVLTTGSTMEACEQALSAAGAKRVDRYAICRTAE